MRTVEERIARPAEHVLEERISCIRSHAAESIRHLRSAFSCCESPLERAFFLEYIGLYDAEWAWDGTERPIYCHTMHADQYTGLKQEHTVFIAPQVEIETPSGKYRVDFLITIRTFRERQWQTVQDLVVEIDGHDYHERTKEQARRDRSRDRALLAMGYKVIRFTGSEVYRNPLETVFEFSEFIREACSNG